VSKNSSAPLEPVVERGRLTGRSWRMLIGGELVDSAHGATLPVTDPARGETIATIPRAGTDDVESAVAAAHAAFPAWRRTPAAERATLVTRLANLIEQHGEELALIDTIDNGTPLRVMRGDFSIAVAQLRYLAGLALEVRGDTLPTPEIGSLDFTVREPFGVVARIVPFNHPLMFAATKLAAPLLTGNTIVLKPAEHTSLSALRLAELCQGLFPPGVVNVISGRGSEIGDHLVGHRDVARVALVGSVATGLRVQREAAREHVKAVTLELGGKNPIVVFPDANRAAALAGVIQGMNFTWQGQSCGSTSRLYVHRSLYEGFTAELATAIDDLVVGDPLDPATDVGAIVSAEQYASVCRYIEQATADRRVRLLAGGGPASVAGLDGLFVRPTLFGLEHEADVAVATEEVFGPVLVAMPFDEFDDVIARANALSVGLTASVWTQSLGTAMRASRDLETGYVWINASSAHIPGAPFGGVKDSGVGREESVEELLSYTTTKNVYVRFER
jgi:betaine-aldehyde dehydrogenase